MPHRFLPKDLPKFWALPDNSKLIPKQLSIRLSAQVAAKIFALEEVYPGKTRTQIIGNLLSCALTGIEEGLPQFEGDVIGKDPQGGDIVELYGPKVDYQDAYQRHLAKLEEEIVGAVSKDKK